MQTRWWARRPLSEVPRKKNDLVIEIEFEESSEPDDLCKSEDEAWKAVRQYLIEQRAQALRELDLHSKGYTSSGGLTYRCPQETVDAWKDEASRRLEIAERGLELCPTER